MKILLIIVIAVLFSLPANAQDIDDKPRNVKPELKQVYKEWLDTDVCAFISIDPRDAYFKMQTDEERDKFVDDYWTKLEADPEKGPANDRYERTAFAEEHFTSGIIGSKTDRGRIYILWGKPDNIIRGRMRIAGRETDVPFEKWRCDGRDLTFIDPAETGDYRLIKDEEKVQK